MPTEKIYPRSNYGVTGVIDQTNEESLWYRGLSQAINYSRVQLNISAFNAYFDGWGRFDATTNDWCGKTQAYTGAVFSCTHSDSGDFSWNDLLLNTALFNDTTFVDNFFTGMQDGGGLNTQTTTTLSLDVADWGTDFVNVTDANFRFLTQDGGINPSTCFIRIWNMFIEGTYSQPMGGATLNSQEIIKNETDHNNTWQSGWDTQLSTADYGWFASRLQVASPFTGYAYNISGIANDPSYDSPQINSPAGWTDHTNGETPTQAFFILEHNWQGVDNDDIRIELVQGATPTLVEELWSELDGNGDFTETSANITTASTWDTHAVRWRYVSSAGMMDSAQPTAYRLRADLQFPGLAGSVLAAIASPAGALDSAAFLAGEILFGGNPSGSQESASLLSLAPAQVTAASARATGSLDSTSAYVEAYDTLDLLDGVYLSGTNVAFASAFGRLDSLVGQAVDGSTIPDSTLVTYRLLLKDVTGTESDIELPCINVNAVSRNGSPSRATFVVPDIDTHLPTINTRLDGTLVLRATLTALDGSVDFTDDIVVVDIDEIETERAASESTITLSGSKQRTFGAGKYWQVQTEGNIEEGVDSDRKYIVTLDDPRVRPGDLIDIQDVVQATIAEVGINIVPSSNLRTMRLVAS